MRILFYCTMILGFSLPVLASDAIPNHSFEDFDDTTWQCDDNIILQELSDDDKVKLCVKKKTIEECSNITPAAGVETVYDFAFENKTVR